MRKYIIMGVQGSGKGTHAKLLAETLDLEHISVGDIFRWNVQHHTKLGAQVRRSVAAGELVSDDLVASVVQRRLDEHDWNFGFIIDGFPRNQPQARFFLESYDLDAVILLEVPDQVVTERILSRRLCSRCGVDYNLISHRPAVVGVCDMCGGRLVARADDTPEAVQGRLRDYHDKTRPLLELFRAKEVVAAVDATGPVAQVQAAIHDQLGLEPPSA
jgi:adenylate kinase